MKCLLILVLCLFCNVFSEPFETWPTGNTRDYAHVVISGVANIVSYEALHFILPDVKKKYKFIGSNIFAISLGLYKEVGDIDTYGFYNTEDMYYNFCGVLVSSGILMVYRF